jgi:anhydro-N-acetylmuramic acid kinase
MKPISVDRKPMLVLGLMSGTSADGMDVALVRIAPRRGKPAAVLDARLLDFHTLPFPAAVRKEILRIANGGGCTSADISNLNFLLGKLFARAALAACARFRVRPGQISLIGSHGQTIYHQGRPQPYLRTWRTASTLQIGEPAVIAERTGITTIGDFRVADMAAGGQGAPLVPFVDYLLYRHPTRARLALNIGGIANLTLIPAAAAPQQVMAFDTGPGNMLIDALVHNLTRGRQSFDRNAQMARRGTLLPTLLNQLLAHTYFRQKPPKTCGREQFGEAFAQRVLRMARRSRRVKAEDLIRTVTLLTPLSILASIHRWVIPQFVGGVTLGPFDLILSGGGAHNPLIRAQLEAGLAGRGIHILTSGELGVPEDGKEAYAFAILAYETWHRRASNLPSATGARHPAILGKICYAPEK